MFILTHFYFHIYYRKVVSHQNKKKLDIVKAAALSYMVVSGAAVDGAAGLFYKLSLVNVRNVRFNVKVAVFFTRD